MMTAPAIPLVDLKAQYAAIRGEIDAAMARVLASAAFVGGAEVTAFESAFAAYCGVPACVGVGNGTDALTLALRALDIGPGDEVITVANTFIATSEAISAVGARVVFADVDEATMLLDPARLEAAITSRTRAIMPVHLYGQMCDMPAILAIAGRHGLKVVEDAAQAHGARFDGKRAGGFGHLACFSFYPGKNLGAYGDGGAVVGRDEPLVDRVRLLANHGRRSKYLHDVEGVNSRLDGLQAAVLGVKLRHLDTWNETRRALARAYDAALGDLPVRPLAIDPRGEPVHHLYVVRVADRDGLAAGLRQDGIATGVHYPVPLHQQPAYRHLGLAPGALPATELVAPELLSLPLYPELTLAQVERVAAAIRRLRPRAAA